MILMMTMKVAMSHKVETTRLVKMTMADNDYYDDDNGDDNTVTMMTMTIITTVTIVIKSLTYVSYKLK